MQWNCKECATKIWSYIIALIMVLEENPKPLIQHIILMQAFSQMDVCMSSGCPRFKENWLIFHMLPYKIVHLSRCYNELVPPIHITTFYDSTLGAEIIFCAIHKAAQYNGNRTINYYIACEEIWIRNSILVYRI